MINIKPKIHDSNTLEFKVGFLPNDGKTYDDFYMNTWIFIPERLDVNKHTYSKDTFYCDTISYLRLITPRYELRELTDEHSLPFTRMKQACENPVNENKEFETEIKMYASIVKSSMRDAYLKIAHQTNRDIQFDMSCDLVEHAKTVTTMYRSLRPILLENDEGKEVSTFYDFGDEFISNIVEQHLGRIVKMLNPRSSSVTGSPLLSMLTQLLDSEHKYRKSHNYLDVDPYSADDNRQFVYHASQLKKYIESNLYLPTHKRRNTAFLEQVAFSVAAGISMVFATVVSFAFQQTYGNFTLPFFIALVISYMFKDRIKDLIRNYFAHGLGSRFYDYLITIRVGLRKIGKVKEGFDFVSPQDVSRHVNEKRARKNPLVVNRGVDEQVIQYRKYVHLKRKAVDQLSAYPINGINNIVRFNLAGFMRKMDNPTVPLYVNQGDAANHFTKGDKAYYLNFIIQCKYEGISEYKRYRVCLCRDGIKNIEEKKQ
ncbi:MAG: hypothetical protein IKX31_01420 [Muribaculaceae bacterium]|nr:hypothetical protein [Muribaculaceae bacterium]